MKRGFGIAGVLFSGAGLLAAIGGDPWWVAYTCVGLILIPPQGVEE